MDNQYEKGFADIEFAANLIEDEEITKQAQLLISQLEEAQLEEQMKLDEAIRGEGKNAFVGPIQREIKIEPSELEQSREGGR